MIPFKNIFLCLSLAVLNLSYQLTASAISTDVNKIRRIDSSRVMNPGADSEDMFYFPENPSVFSTSAHGSIYIKPEDMTRALEEIGTFTTPSGTVIQTDKEELEEYLFAINTEAEKKDAAIEAKLQAKKFAIARQEEVAQKRAVTMRAFEENLDHALEQALPTDFSVRGAGNAFMQSALRLVTTGHLFAHVPEKK